MKPILARFLVVINKGAAKESIVDVFIGLMVSFPVAFGVLTFAQSIDLSVGATALMQTVVFTCLALLRKYLVRLFFLQSQK